MLVVKWQAIHIVLTVLLLNNKTTESLHAHICIQKCLGTHLIVSSDTEAGQDLWGFWAQTSFCLPLCFIIENGLRSMTFPEFHQAGSDS